MSKRKPIYLLYIYRRGKGENLPLRQNFGAFSSAERAIKEVKVNGLEMIKDFARGYNPKDLFFAVLEFEVDSENQWGWAHCALDLNGEKTYWFNHE
jgi:hypothetical protein